MGKKSKRKREKFSKTKLKLPEEEDQDSPPMVQAQQRPAERQGESSNDSASSSSASHGSWSASPREEIVMQEREVGTQKGGGIAEVGGHTQSIDQQLEEGVTTEQLVEERGNIDQQLEEGGSTDQQLEEGGSTDQQLEEEGNIDQQLEEGGSTEQLVEEGGNIDQQLEEGGSTDQQLEEGGSTDQQLEEEGNIDQLVEKGGSTDQQLEEGGSTDQLVEEGGSTEQLVEEGGNIDQQLEEGGSTDQQLEEGGSTDQQLEEEGNIDQQLEEGGSTDQQLEEGGNIDQQLEEGGSTDQQVEEGGSTDQQLEEEGSTEQLVEEGGSTDQQLEEGGSTDQLVEEGGSIDQQLDEVAVKSNLSVLNVKSILHHVLKDRRVLAMVQKRVAEEEGKELSSEWQEDIVTYEPKLTRSHVRQAVASSVARGAVSPEKIASLTRASITPTKAESSKKQPSHPLLDVTFSEESSDEEYNPATDMSEGESEGEESEEGEWGGTPSWDPKAPQIEEEQEARTHTTTTVPAESPSPAPQAALVAVSQPMDTTATEVHTSSSNPALSTAPELSTAPQIGPSSAAYDPVISMPASTVAQTSYTLTSTTEVFNSEVCTLTRPSAPSLSDTQPTIPQTPALLSTAQPPVSQSDDLVVQEAAALLASLSDTILSPMKLHMSQAQGDVNQSFVSNKEDEDLIATRTRSKHPLTDTSISVIEASFIPPDVEDPPTPMELDDEELEWQKWLHDLMNPSDLPADTSVGGGGTVGGSNDVGVEGGEGGEEVDDGDDVEYIYPADQQPEEEKEEFRNDRAVKIPQKEVDDLLNELLNPDDDGMGGILLSNDGIDLTSAYLLESLGLQPPLLMQASGSGTPQKAPGPSETETYSGSAGPPAGDKPEGCLLSKDQTVQACTQLQQHFQLLMQTFVLSRFEPSLVFLSQISAQAIEEIGRWCDEAKEGKNSPVWYIPDLEEARELVQRLDPNTESVELVPATGNPPRIPEVAQDIIINEPVFWKYPKLLPGIGFTALTKDNASGSKYFTTEEDYLLVLGMNHYGLSSWKLIQENILPTKSIKQLQLRVKNQCSKRTGDNVVKHYKKTKEVKIPYKDNGEEKVPDLPQWVLQYHKKRQDKEKLQEKMREKEANDSSKMAKLLDGVLKPSTKPVALKAKVPGAPNSVSSASGEAAVVGDNGQASSSSKRNLTSRLQEAESEAKRLCLDQTENGDRLSGTSLVESPSQGSRGRQKGGKRGRKRGQPGRKAQQTPGTSPLTTSLGSSNCVSAVNAPQPLNGAGVGHLSVTASPLKHTSNPKGDMEQLLWAAGLEACDPTARYAYNYLNEVKATLLDSKQGTYEKFLKTLLDAKRQRWKPSKLFHKVQQILQPWPHLIKLFTEFMEPQDCLEAEAMADKYELESVKAFVETLQAKFASAPLQLEDVIRRLKKLNTPNVTREKIQSSLLPLIDAHEQLVTELKRILFQLAPPPRTEDVYEEIAIGSDCEKEPDEFEEVILPEPSPVRVEGKKRSLKHREEMPPTKSPQIQPNSVENLVSMNNAQKIVEEKSRNQFESVNVAKPSEGALSSHALATLDNSKDSNQTSGGTSLVQIATETSLSLVPSGDSLPVGKLLDVTTMKQHENHGRGGNIESGTVNNMADISLTGPQTLWTREEDRVVLQCSLHQQSEGSVEALRNVAKQLNRTETEVQQRYKQLLVLFHSSYSDGPPP